MYGAYISNTFKYDEKTTFSASARANIAFVELIDNFKTNIYTRTAFINGDHRYFRLNPSLGFVRELSDNTLITSKF